MTYENTKKIILAAAGSLFIVAANQAHAVTVHNMGAIGNGISDKSHREGRAGTTTKPPKLPGAAPKSWGDDDSRVYKAWGHNGEWYAFQAENSGTIKLKLTADDSATLSPAMTVYSSDGIWNGENNGGAAAFNQVGLIQNDDKGATWFKEASRDQPGVTGNGTATLGYANSGKSVTAAQSSITITTKRGRKRTGYGQVYNTGAFDLDVNDSLLVTGDVGEGMAELMLHDAPAGWYFAFIGGADKSKIGGDFTLSVSQVPVPAAVYLFGSGLLGLVSIRRKQVA